jgi:hypothetical protein
VIGRLLESAIVATVAFFSVRTMRIYFGKKKIRSDFNYGMQVVAKEAVRRAKSEHRIYLDFSPSSIERIEEMLGSIHDRHLDEPLNEKELSLQSIRWGAYIGEMMKQVKAGKWQRDSAKLGKGTMPVVFDSGDEAFPCSWAYKRIADGPDDNIVFKFQFFSDPNLRKHLENDKTAS